MSADKQQREEARQRECEEADLIWEQGRGTWQQRLLEDVRLEVSLALPHGLVLTAHPGQGLWW